MTSENLLIQARALTRIYPLGEAGVTALDRVDLDLSAGSFTVLKGSSGSGKTTLLSLLAGLDTPSSGSLQVAGTDLLRAGEAELTAFRRNQVGIVFQSFNLLPTLNVFENTTLPGLLAGRSRKQVRQRVQDLLAWLGLSGRIDHHPDQLSGGELQRTALARALINDPRLILADEPTGNLDSAAGRAVVELLALMHRDRGRTIVVATHSPDFNAAADRRIELLDGRIQSPA
ncbi:MAG: ABC transporter ATP-binding protein [Desulfohalobiaceae bacterium]|nr:ABC transporter ATP-binding protein [Desulfohalobiaceae bacterium]